MGALIVFVLLGLLATPSLLDKKPKARALLDAIAAYQGWIGLVFAIFGIVMLIPTFGMVMKLHIAGFLHLLILLVAIMISLILSYDLVMSKSPETAEKGQKLMAKLLPLRYKLGVALLCLLALSFLLSLIFFVIRTLG